MASSTETTLQKKTTLELMVEISLLEKEILYLESRLLSLYRSALKNILDSSPFAAHSVSKTPSCHDRSLTIRELNLPHADVTAEEIGFNSCNRMRFSPAHEPASSSNTISCHSTTNDQRTNIQISRSGHRTLADHLGTSIQSHIPETACKISSSSSSCASSSILSPEGPSHIWSPNILHEAASNFFQIELSGSISYWRPFSKYVPNSTLNPWVLSSPLPLISMIYSRLLFASVKKLRKVSNKHPYALDQPEHQAYFALCMGNSSDPSEEGLQSTERCRPLNSHRPTSLLIVTSIPNLDWVFCSPDGDADARFPSLARQGMWLGFCS